jgi:2-iminobutanoate/2-iminopropanoate deaminase
MKKITALNAPTPGGHYSQAIVHNGLIYVSGQLPTQPQTGEKIFDSIEAQTEQVIKNLKAILEAAGSSLSQVIKTTIYIADIHLWDRVNHVYASYFGEHRPARVIVPTGPLHHGFLIEMEAIATTENSEDN